MRCLVIYSYDISYTGTELDDEEKDVISHWRLQDAARRSLSTRPTSRIRISEELLLDKEANIDRNQDGKLSTEIALVQDIDVIRYGNR